MTGRETGGPRPSEGSELRLPGGIVVEPRRTGLLAPTKAGFPVRYGEHGRVTTPELVVDVDRGGRVRFVQGRGELWPDPLEYLKRTDGDDWVYYSLGEYADLESIYGERYLPCPAYPTNRPLGGEPFRDPAVGAALRAWPRVVREVRDLAGRLPELEPFALRLAESEPERLARHADELHRIVGSRLPVLPPDARHVDYDVVPLVVADGCRYGCAFCRVTDRRPLAPRSRDEVREQLAALRRWLGPQAGNVQGLFLGLHDALGAGEELLLFAAEAAHRDLGFEGSPFARPQLSMFGSVDSLLGASDRLFEGLAASPWTSFVNVGLEAADDGILAALGKPLTRAKVGAALDRMVEVNARWPQVEVTANFVLPPGEDRRADDALVDLLETHVPRRTSRGVGYLSPLMVDDRRPRAGRRAVLTRVQALQRASRLPLLLYLIQRL